MTLLYKFGGTAINQLSTYLVFGLQSSQGRLAVAQRRLDTSERQTHTGRTRKKRRQVGVSVRCFASLLSILTRIYMWPVVMAPRRKFCGLPTVRGGHAAQKRTSVRYSVVARPAAQIPTRCKKTQNQRGESSTLDTGFGLESACYLHVRHKKTTLLRMSSPLRGPPEDVLYHTLWDNLYLHRYSNAPQQRGYMALTEYGQYIVDYVGIPPFVSVRP